MPAPNQDILVSLESAAGAAELYLGRGYLPTLQHYDARSTEWESRSATVAAVNTLPETYYLLAYASALPGATGFAVQARVLEFGLISVSPTAVGNDGPATVHLRGGQLRADMLYTLVAGNGTEYAATTVRWEDSTSVYATFNLTGAPAGLYDVRVSNPAGGSKTLPDALRISAGTGPILVTEITVPSAVRVGRVFYGQVRYENVGDADMTGPHPDLDSSGEAAMRLAGGDFSTESLQLIAAAPEGPAGILRPGQKGGILFEARANQTGHVQFDLTYHTADDKTLMDWSAFKTRMSPGRHAARRVGGGMGRFHRGSAAALAGGYVAALARYATSGSRARGQPRRSPGRVSFGDPGDPHPAHQQCPGHALPEGYCAPTRRGGVIAGGQQPSRLRLLQDRE